MLTKITIPSYQTNSKSCLKLSDVPVNWKEAFEQCSSINGRLFAPRYHSEWKAALLALRDGSQPSDDEVFWTGLFLNNIGNVVSSYGETMSKIVSDSSIDFFLPNSDFIRNQVKQGQSQLMATFNGFALKSETEFPFVCEYIGKFILTTFKIG